MAAQRRRGPAPEDERRFGAEALPALARAASELAWLLDRGYALRSALQLVGNRHGLDTRQRLALQRATCAHADAAARRSREVPTAAVRGEPVLVDGFNLLTTVEAALGGGLVLRAMDGCLRDLAGLSGTWRRVAETEPATLRIGEAFAAAGIATAHWLLDAPVGNSGRLAVLLRAAAAQQGWPWDVDVVASPDAELRTARGIAVTADSGILDAGVRWWNAAAAVLPALPVAPWLVDLGSG